MAITMKSTKQEIMDAYMEAKKRLDDADAMKDDPVAAANEAKKAAVFESAEQSASENIFNPEIIEKYENILKATEMKRKELQDLYGIEAKANSMVAMINAYKDKDAEIKEKQADDKAAYEKMMEEKKELLTSEIDALCEKRTQKLVELDEAENLRKKELEIARKREEEEYQYTIQRAHKITEDEWNDRINKEKDELKARMDEIAVEEAVLEEKKEYIADLEEKVNRIPGMLDEAREEGIKKGKADADKSNAFEVRALKKENEYQVQLLTNKCERLESDLAAIKAEKTEIQAKLDDAYSQMRDLAARTVESTGGVKILNGANGNNTTK